MPLALSLSISVVSLSLLEITRIPYEQEFDEVVIVFGTTAGGLRCHFLF